MDMMTGEDSLDFEIQFYQSVVEQSPRYADALQLLGESYTRKGLFREGLEIDRRLIELKPGDPIVHYNLACSYSLLNRKREALRSLRRSVAMGYSDLKHLTTDGDLAPLRGDPSFRKLIARLCKKLLKMVQKREDRSAFLPYHNS